MVLICIQVISLFNGKEIRHYVLATLPFVNLGALDHGTVN